MNLLVLAIVAVVFSIGGAFIKEPTAHAIVMVQNIFDAPIPKSDESARIDAENEKARMLLNNKKTKCFNMLKPNKGIEPAYETLRLAYCMDTDQETGLPYSYVPTWAELKSPQKEAPTPPLLKLETAEATPTQGKLNAQG